MQNAYNAQTVKSRLQTNVFPGTGNYSVETTSLGKTPGEGPGNKQLL